MRLKLPKFVIFGLFLGGSLSVSGQQGPAWTPEILAGKAITQPGADCHNATLIGKGYEDEIVSVSPDHMSFYLKNFCQQSAEAAVAGDIFVVTNRLGLLEHTALALADGKIFEKESGDGLYKNISHMSPYYQIKDLEDSIYYKNRITQHLMFTTYKCQDAKSVREQLKVCETRADEFGVKKIRQEFQKMMFTTSHTFSLSPNALTLANSFADAIGRMNREEPCLRYLQIMADSIATSVNILVTHQAFIEFSQHDAWLEVAKRLTDANAMAGGQWPPSDQGFQVNPAALNIKQIN